jgi:hypothetical protein
MPKYFFHVYHNEPEIDYEGKELPDKHAAWREATVMAGRTLQGLALQLPFFEMGALSDRLVNSAPV